MEVGKLPSLQIFSHLDFLLTGTEDSGSDDDACIPEIPVPDYVKAIQHREPAPPNQREAKKARKAVREGQKEARKFFQRDALGQIDTSVKREEFTNGENVEMQGKPRLLLSRSYSCYLLVVRTAN